MHGRPTLVEQEASPNNTPEGRGQPHLLKVKLTFPLGTAWMLAWLIKRVFLKATPHCGCLAIKFQQFYWPLIWCESIINLSITKVTKYLLAY